MSSPSRTARRAVILAVLALAIFAGCASTALAGPAAPEMMSVSELRAALAASPSGTLSGSFKTVMKGYAVVDVPATVVAVVTDSPGTSLILFTATGDPVAGGIASGMSGSPLYVDDGGTDKLVGAVAYAGEFALDAAGLATPIEDMAKLESLNSVQASALDRPVIAGGSVVDRVILTDEPARYSGEAVAGALVAHPLSTTFVGGLKPTSSAYKLFSTALKAQGLTPTAMSASGVSAEALPVQSLDPGASIAALVATGDAWVGGVGTETYANGENLLAFGHPLFGFGPTSMFLTDAWVDGAWKSSQSSFKFASPSGPSRGAFTQDRTAGMLAKIGQEIATTGVTAHAKRLSASGTTVDETSSVVTFSQPLFNSPLGFAYLSSGAVAIPGSRLYDSAYNPGSALTTTTIVVSDGSKTHTILLTDIMDDAADITAATSTDVTYAISELMTVFDSGLYADGLSIQSVDLDATYSPKRRLAYISDVEAPNGLVVGENVVRVKLLPYGAEAPVYVEKKVTIPSDASLTGRLVATCANSLAQGSAEGSSLPLAMAGDDSGPDSPPSAPDRRTIGAIVSDVNASYAFNDLIVRVVPGSSGDDELASGQETSGTIEAAATTGYFLQGNATKTLASLKLALEHATVPFGGTATVTGELSGAEAGASVDVYATPAGESERFVTTVKTAFSGESETPGFTAAISGLQKNTKLRVVFKGSDSATFAQQTTSVKVSAKTSISSSKRQIKKGKTVRLTAKVSPAATAGGKVAFEYYSKRYHRWKALATRTLAVSGTRATASYTWRIKSKGTWRTRVRALKGATNAGGTSAAITIKVK